MAGKPSFRSSAVSAIDLTSTLQRGAVSRPVESVAPPAPRPGPVPIAVVEERPAATPRKQIDSRKKKLAHLKTLLEYEEKKEITGLLRELADVVGHNIQFSIFNRALLLAALAQKDEFLRAARRFEGLERPSNGDVEAFRQYESEIAQMIFSAFDIRGTAPKRQK